ncbi:hypothetical protein CN126_28375 [Sinorhizobium meliloti]|nr:hypothetical protein CN162_28700 [Sinorhizobium meliloti]RVM69669.1 hypothetical protein CN126_28375 [Sinorhizobium meliloti]RVM82359.1 hypothetical protein CN122_29310 [Sinorhizobium meliloti]RVN67874.1 hypothetical protein CN110_24500 [Sinorhizobium meliloti]
MPAVVKMPCLLLCSTASRMRAFVLKAGKERVMIKELANEHKRASAVLNRPRFLDQRRLEFSGFIQGGGLVAPPEFISAIGTLLPIAP